MTRIVWEGLQSYTKCSWSPKNQSQSHYLQMENFSTIANFPRSRRPYKTPPRAQQQLIQEATNAHGQHRRNYRPLLHQLSKRHLAENSIHERVVRQKPPLTKNSITACLINTPWWSSNLVGECLVDWWFKSVWKPVTESHLSTAQ